ncbi:MAG: hypothetical protein H0W99_00060 [Acidobacteria bacterium]|nr:hypothetical protein [Acidobacteriota bacterium]
MKRNGQRDAYFDLLLKIRATQRDEFEALAPALKIRALEYGSRMKEVELKTDEENKKSSSDEDFTTR